MHVAAAIPSRKASQFLTQSVILSDTVTALGPILRISATAPSCSSRTASSTAAKPRTAIRLDVLSFDIVRSTADRLPLLPFTLTEQKHRPEEEEAAVPMRPITTILMAHLPLSTQPSHQLRDHLWSGET